MSESKRQSVEKLTDIVARFTAMISKRMPNDVVKKLEQLRDLENEGIAKIIYTTMFDNMDKAINLSPRPVRIRAKSCFSLRLAVTSLY